MDFKAVLFPLTELFQMGSGIKKKEKMVTAFSQLIFHLPVSLSTLSMLLGLPDYWLKSTTREFPVGPVLVRTLCFHC